MRNHARAQVHARVRPAGWLSRAAAATALALPLSLIGVHPGTPSPVDAAPARPPQASAAFLAGLPLRFEPEAEQPAWDARFVARGARYGISLNARGMALTLAGRHGEAALGMRLVGADASARVAGAARLRGVSNYLIGDRRAWRTGVANYGRVRVAGAYHGIDLEYYGTQRQVEYDFIVAPGADPGAIRLAFSGVRRLSLDGHGDLVLGLAGGGTVVQRAPVLYQQGAHGRTAVAGRFALRGGTVGFQVGRYDRGRALTIDPVLTYVSYLGGAGEDSATSVATDAQGNVFVAGYTSASGGCAPINGQALPRSCAPVRFDGVSGDFPLKAGGFQTVRGGGFDAFVAKFTPAGNGAADQIYTTYLGGSGDDFVGTDQPFSARSDALNGTDLSGNGLAVDAAGNAYVTGFTTSPNFPLQGAFQAAFSGGGDAFVSELNAAGSGLLYSTYLGGNTLALGTSLAVRGGNVYVTGCAGPGSNNKPAPINGSSPQTHHGDSHSQAARTSRPRLPVPGILTFPVTNLTTINANAGTNAFAVELSPGTAGAAGLLYGTVFGGSANDCGQGIAVDGTGKIDVAGTTESDDFPTTPDAFQAIFAGNSTDFDPYINDTVFGSSENGSNAFVVQLKPANPTAAFGSQLTYGTYENSGFTNGACPPSVMGHGVAVDGKGTIYIVGTAEADCGGAFPTTPNAFQTTFAGDDRAEAFVSAFNPVSGRLVYSTLYGTPPGGNSGFDDRGDDEDTTGNGIAVDQAGSVYITGYTSNDITTTPGAAVPDTFISTGTTTKQKGAYLAEFIPNSVLVSPARQLVYASYLSGGTADASNDYGYAVAVDAAGAVSWAGGTFGSLPVAPNPGAFQTALGGSEDAFFAHFLPNLGGGYQAPLCTVAGVVATLQTATAPATRAYLALLTSATPGNTFLPFLQFRYGYSYFVARNLTLNCVRPGLTSAVITLTGPVMLRHPGNGIFAGATTATVVITLGQGLPGGGLYGTVDVTLNSTVPFHTTVPLQLGSVATLSPSLHILPS